MYKDTAEAFRYRHMELLFLGFGPAGKLWGLNLATVLPTSKWRETQDSGGDLLGLDNWKRVWGVGRKGKMSRMIEVA